MSESHLILLLQLVSKKADVNSLLKRGLRYQQISRLLAKANKEGLVEIVDGEPFLTDKGKLRIDASFYGKHHRYDSGWISPEEESRIESQPINRVFLPKLPNSYFKTRDAD